MPNTYVALRTETVAVATSSVTFNLSGISGYTDLRIIANVRSTRSALSDTFYMRLNGDTGSNYSWTFIRGDGSSASSFRAANVVGLGVGEVIAANQTAGIFNLIKIDLMNYSNTTTNKTSISRSDVAANYGAEAWVSMWRNTAAVTSMTLFMANGSNIEAGSTFSLYGIANVNTANAKATGGTIYEDSSYWYHVFNASGTFTPSQTLSCQYLVVAGGGGGGGNNTAGGGGGGGGYRSSMLGQLSGANSSPESTVSLVSATNYTVTIGGGGPGAVPISAGTNGTASSIIGGAVSISSAGGGGGGGGNGVVGGSGGGGSGQTANGITGAAGTSLQGLAGGNGLQTSVNYSGGGGGGAGAIGSNGTSQYGGNGGAGITANLYGFVTFAGGGGGANTNDPAGPASIAGGLGGIGGGGNGGRGSNSFGQAGFPGTPNTGGGGGGGGTHTGVQVYNGGAGGSGIVIIRYAK